MASQDVYMYVKSHRVLSSGMCGCVWSAVWQKFITISEWPRTHLQDKKNKLSKMQTEHNYDVCLLGLSKTSFIVTAVKAPQKTMFFNHTEHNYASYFLLHLVSNWRCRQSVPAKCHLISAKLCSIKFQKTVLVTVNLKSNIYESIL